MKHESLAYMRQLHEDDDPGWLQKTNKFRDDIALDLVNEHKNA